MKTDAANSKKKKKVQARRREAKVNVNEDTACQASQEKWRAVRLDKRSVF
jgi:hypothetical protein